MNKRLAADYTAQDVELAQQTYLTLARVLGDYSDELVVIGGFVPYLLVPQESLDADEAHIGTADLDIVLHLRLLNAEAYKQVSELLRESEFEPDDKLETGAVVPQRWVAPGTSGRAIVEFLLPPTEEEPLKKRVKNLEEDFAAFLLPGGDLAFEDARKIDVSGGDLRGASVTRSMQVCGPASFLVLKALAHANRDKPKDAYDIDYLVARIPGGNATIVEAFERLPDSELVWDALERLERAFAKLDSSGPVDVAEFIGDPGNDELQRDVSARVSNLLQDLREAGAMR